MGTSQSWPVADLPEPPESTVLAKAARPPRPWLVPVIVGAVAGVGLAAWWAGISSGPPCFSPARALGFGLLVLMVLGTVATSGVGLAVGSLRPKRRRIGKALTLAGLAAVAVFLVVTSIAPFVAPFVAGSCPV